MILEAGRIGPIAARTVARSPCGRAIARFERSAYVAMGDELVCLVLPGLHDGPLNIQVRALPERHEPCRIDTRGAVIWRPRDLPARIEPAAVARKLGQPPRLPTMAAMVALLGRGEGLTPAGDDRVAGIMLAHRALGLPLDVAALLQAARQRTHELSLTHLRAAAEGLAAAPLHEALYALLDPQVVDARLALAAAERIGASSGREALLGIRSTLGAWVADKLLERI